MACRFPMAIEFIVYGPPPLDGLSQNLGQVKEGNPVSVCPSFQSSLDLSPYSDPGSSDHACLDHWMVEIVGRLFVLPSRRHEDEPNERTVVPRHPLDFFQNKGHRLKSPFRLRRADLERVRPIPGPQQGIRQQDPIHFPLTDCRLTLDDGPRYKGGGPRPPNGPRPFREGREPT
jgi:hypothetical protein